MFNLHAHLRSLAVMFLAGLLAASLPVSAQAQAVLMGKDNWLFYAGDDISHSGGDAIHANVSLMRDAGQMLKVGNVGLVVLVVPLKARFQQAELPEGTSISAAAQPRYAAILDELAKAGIPSVDLIAVMSKVGQGGQDVFFRKDSHWTAWSSEAAAEATAALIAGTWPLSGQVGTGRVLGEWVKERRFSDFTELMTAAQRKSVGQEIYTVRKLLDQGGLLDDDTPVVQVIGNSSVQPYLGFPQMLSHTLDRPVGLSWKYGNFGPWAVFLEYLESSEFRQHRPAVVVWQLNESQLLYGPDVAGQWDASSLMSATMWRARVQAALAR